MRKLGTVHLVGAGPGDPDLLTLKAARLIETADAVAYDRLVSDAVMEMVPAGAEQVFVGKESGCHHCSQDRINTILLELARRHGTVVRLKGGDPFVFGRGGEEAEFLARHGVEVRVTPGITSAAACGAIAGVPLTHRGLATGVRFVTGHAKGDAPLDLNWKSLADPDTTLVVYMGLATLPRLSAHLIGHGLPSDTPVLAVQNGTTPRERRLLTTLGEAAVSLALARFRPPTLLIIGRVAALADAPELVAEAEAAAPDAAPPAVALAHA
ncbi:Uroporphyrinogen-III methyltransferase [Caenispirillum salinarum AK4]|uniref:uroporphyrinogen-III C-methyltransferase n=1 Tax=Caenispirillum salinarum AK4 TaxID=1238182 RepID=K9GNV4_9PROT|nr:uroporphyrinogen-III C-methyltransferase [Caenispirillum salinarum]EKV27615.1 Uroporphyrinogen-III methyltransferase [Caenispirillum salinarum AK4]